MTFQALDGVADALLDSFGVGMRMDALPLGNRALMRYPRFPALMRLAARQYAVEGFGNVFAMHTRAMGLMQLATLVFTPNCGTAVPLLLIDVMAFGKKKAAFVEYYDCTGQNADMPRLTAVAAQYTALPDYVERPAWYVPERTPYSLIKGGQDDNKLLQMLLDSVAAYAASVQENMKASPENRAGLAAFVERMVKEGNPSTATMERVLGKAGAEDFFRTAIMPKDYKSMQ